MIELFVALLVPQPLVYENPYEPVPTIEQRIIQELGPDMLAVAECESNLRQYTNGEPTRSHTNDVGIMQINEAVWLEESLELGHDIYSLIGNIKMAKHIMNKQGKSAWNASRHCWDRG